MEYGIEYATASGAGYADEYDATEREVVGWWKAGVCTDARTCDPRQVGWCTRIPKMTEKETPGAGIAVVAAAQQASAQVKLSSRQHDAPATRLVCCSERYEAW